ncbi:uncharacterized protein PG986_010269 [Apiospora aurea]|uniref:Uncharacterized protein n=1 Tax=Apiospora aurea TaxID=335848 RepID=A0ABR1QA25_9PEZI
MVAAAAAADNFRYHQQRTATPSRDRDYVPPNIADERHHLEEEDDGDYDDTNDPNKPAAPALHDALSRALDEGIAQELVNDPRGRGQAIAPDSTASVLVLPFNERFRHFAATNEVMMRRDRVPSTLSGLNIVVNPQCLSTLADSTTRASGLGLVWTIPSGFNNGLHVGLIVGIFAVTNVKAGANLIIIGVVMATFPIVSATVVALYVLHDYQGQTPGQLHQYNNIDSTGPSS